MNITTIGRGTIGGTLAKLWTAAGHRVTELGHDGGDAADADVVLLAVPNEAVPDALAGVTGLDGKVVIDATNRIGELAPPSGYPSIAEYVKAQTAGPVAKAFNLNFGELLDRAASAAHRPGNIWVGDEEAKAAVERLSEDVGMVALYGGALDRAATQEAFGDVLMSIVKEAGGLVFYRFATPEDF